MLKLKRHAAALLRTMYINEPVRPVSLKADSSSLTNDSSWGSDAPRLCGGGTRKQQQCPAQHECGLSDSLLAGALFAAVSALGQARQLLRHVRKEAAQATMLMPRR